MVKINAVTAVSQAQRLANAVQRERHFANGFRLKSWTGKKARICTDLSMPYLSAKIT